MHQSIYEVTDTTSLDVYNLADNSKFSITLVRELTKYIDCVEICLNKLSVYYYSLAKPRPMQSSAMSGLSVCSPVEKNIEINNNYCQDQTQVNLT